jgi:hypothetical protein
MAKTKISEFSPTPANNTDIDNINIAEGCAPSGINDAIRELMAQLKDFQAGTAGDSFNGPIGTSTAAAGAFTTLSSTGATTLGDAAGDAITVNGATTFANVNPTLTAGTANGVTYLNGSKVLTSGSALTFDGTNFGVGVSAPYGGVYATIHAFSAGGATLRLDRTGAGTSTIQSIETGTAYRDLTLDAANNIFSISGSERARIDSSGNLLVGTTDSNPVGNRVNGSVIRPNGGFASRTVASNRDWGISVTSGSIVNFYSDNGSATVYAGAINVNGNTTAYTSASDYRLKEDVQPMTGALAKVQLLKPVTYIYKDGGQKSQGFIAHELQEVCPEAVTGEKDAVDAEGKPQYQGIDTSFLVATLTAAIQELKAEFDAYKTAHP